MIVTSSDTNTTRLITTTAQHNIKQQNHIHGEGCRGTPATSSRPAATRFPERRVVV